MPMAPKDPAKRARRNADPIPHTVLQFEPSTQPPLPDLGELEWHAQTIEWWDVWGRSPLSAAFTEADWQFLLDTARVHTMAWNGSLQAHAELRQRVARFGSTPEDRARLRIFFANADKQDKDRGSDDAPKAAKRNTAGLKFTSGGDVVPIR